MHQNDDKWTAFNAMKEGFDCLEYDSDNPAIIRDNDLMYWFAVEGLQADLEILGFDKNEAIRLSEGK